MNSFIAYTVDCSQLSSVEAYCIWRVQPVTFKHCSDSDNDNENDNDNDNDNDDDDNGNDNNNDDNNDIHKYTR